MDTISELPDEIIIKILSFLSIDKAATTSLLSKRWRDLFAFTPNLHLAFNTSSFRAKTPNFVGSRQKFVDFVERVLAVSGSSAIRKFTLNCRDIESAHTNSWIRNVLKRGGIFELYLILDKAYVDLKVFPCNTLVKLNLSNVRIPMLPKDASFPALKYLSLNLLEFVNLEAFEKLISACPLLEEFTCYAMGLEFWKCCHFLSVPTLRRFYISCFKEDELGSMSFNNPNLLYLSYTDYLQLRYPVVNLDSLVEAKLNILPESRKPSNSDPSNLNNSDPSNLIKGLRNVKILSLSFPKTLELFEIFHEAVPVFEKLIRLSITSPHLCISTSSLPSLLKKCPNLQILVIKGPVCGYREFDLFSPCLSENSCILSSPVKVLELTKYTGSISMNDLGQIKRFLEELSCLELVKVYGYAKDDKEELRITKDLLMLPRASSKCKIQVQFSSNSPFHPVFFEATD